MTSFALKIIAMITMLVDHVGDAYIKHFSWMNLIGRIAFPIFAFQISEGYTHTKNLKKYFIRLFLFAIISQVPFMLFDSLFTEGINLNIFFTLFVGLLAIFITDKITSMSFSTLFRSEKSKNIFKYFLSIFIAIILGIVAEICHFDYGFFGIAIIYMFYLFRNNKPAMIISFITACVLHFGINMILYGHYLTYIILALFTILPIIFIAFYNGKQGRKIKYLLYLFYPVHLTILYFLFR